MRIIGVTGGAGSGKSEVLRYLQEYAGAYVCQMDETARDLQKKGTPCYERMIRAFGTEILEEDGELNRKALAAQVFSSREKLELLNSIVHPEVMKTVREDMAAREREGVKLYIVESALLPDVGEGLCDEVWYIYAPEQVRRDRLKRSRGYTDDRVEKMIRSQSGEEVFRRFSTVEIDNGGTFENTKRQIGELL